MANDKNIKTSFLRFAAVITALFAVFLLVKKDNVIRWIQAGFTIAGQERQIRELTLENERLDRELETLSTNRDSLEKFAREELGFAAEGDDIYLTK